MGIQVALHHRTHYRYGKAVSLGPHVIQLRPAPHGRTPVLSYSLAIVPADRILNWHFDPHANHVARVIFPSKTTEFAVDVDLIAELTPVNPFDFFLDPAVENYPFRYPPDLAHELQPFLATGPAGPELQSFLNGLRPAAPTGTTSFVVEVNRRVRERTAYTQRMEHGVQSAEQTLAARSGSCRDSAWLLVETLRHLGIAARFVSGYLIQLANGAPDGPRTDSADLHAWAEAFLPGAGWIGLDATSGLLTAEGHIPLASTPTASAAAPIGGTVEPSSVDFSHSITVRRLNQTPTTQHPFTEEEWQRVRELAHRIDADLQANDVRLTMGGEPTFVGIDEPESPQWNIAAMGPIKRTRGLELIRRLAERSAPGAMLHFGQGKWYPGEALPRWALSCFWRADGVPVWENPNRIAREDQAHNFGAADALTFLQALTRRLEVSTENILPAYNSGPEATEPAGYILPLRRRQPEGRLRWSSQLWFPRPERLLLTLGDSPIGYRISTEAIPWVAPDELVYELDPAHPEKAKLPPEPPRRPELFYREPAPDPLPPLARDPESAPELIRPSLCVQARDGRLHVFLPYASQLSDYLDLLAAVEDTCTHLNKPVWLEGYPPPFDPRLRSFSVTPDPGVLEINLPPAATWDDLERNNTVLFEEALQHRLTAEKFAYDGTHLATGGGSHIVIGGATVADSPLLRRPGLLRSMVAFWQNHPSLSYLFSGMYVGPTSQYPRVDEARMDALYELEVAFSHLPANECPPFILDGLFRNLLVDVTGNSHRAEFCIDKLYPPEGLGLRLGLLELRAFEMAPHIRMGLMQMLLVRALVSAFWKRPYNGGLIRWGTALHDRFMLPHFVARDFAEVLAELRQAGYNFDEKWFAAQVEFRFPPIGSLKAGSVHGHDGAQAIELELRQALEPWNVLAEETVSGGTVRSVDSSLERIQVKLTGLASDSRYVVACNGRRVPIMPTGKTGESIAGIRYRARMLAATLHPTIPVHTPLVFDIIDLWNNRSVGRCTYYAAPPDGRIYSSRPTSLEEANSRRLARFQISPPEPGTMTPPPAENNPIFPATLDLRLPAPAGATSGALP